MDWASVTLDGNACVPLANPGLKKGSLEGLCSGIVDL